MMERPVNLRKISRRRFASRLQIREFRDVDGQLHSKFDLHHFPTDIQELSVSIESALFDTEITLEADPNRSSRSICRSTRMEII